MSSSSENPKNFNKLLEEIKNSEYEVKTLGEIVHTFRGGEGTVTRALKNNGDYPCITAPDIFESSIYVDEYKTFTDLETVKNKTLAEKGDILAVVDGYSPKKNKEGFSICLDDNKPLIGNTIYLLKHNQNAKYLLFSLYSDSVRRQLSVLFTCPMASILRISIKDLKKIKIPLPSLELQEQIGNFLFSFVEYDKQLKREQKARRKQFHYFKEQIFSELVERCGLRDAGWEIKRIEDFATEIYSGSDVTKEQMDTGEFPAIRYKDIHDSNGFIEQCVNFVDPKIIRNIKYVDKNCLILTKVSENVKDSGKACAFVGEGSVILGGGTLAVKHNQNPKYLSYICLSNFVRQQIQNTSNQGTIVNFSMAALKKIQIPLPPLDEQERIVEILDKFYDLTESPSKGLNNLIKLNQKQYEYYRNLIFDHLKI